MVVLSGVISGLARRSSANVLRAIAIGRSIGIAFSLWMGLSGGVIGLPAGGRDLLASGLHSSECMGLIIGFASSVICSVIFVCRSTRSVHSLLSEPMWPVSETLPASFTICGSARCTGMSACFCPFPAWRKHC